MGRSFVAAVVVMAAFPVLAGCGSSSSAPSQSGGSAASNSTPTAQPSSTTESSGKKALKVRVITVSPTNLGTWDPSNYAAYKAIASEYGWDLQIAEAVTYGKAPQVLDGWGNEGVDLVISTDNGFEPSVAKAAAKFPKVKWVIMSALTSKPMPNLAGYSVDWCQFGFAQGVASALISKAHHMGYSAAIPIPPTVQALEGMKLGTKATGIPTQVSVGYSGDFLDTAKATEVTSKLLADGADVVNANVNSVTAAIAARVQSAGKFYIGTNADETKAAPKATVTSATLNFKYAYEQVAKQMQGGTFDPGPHIYGLDVGFIALTPFKLGFDGQYSKAESILKDAAGGKYKTDFAACSKKLK
jgi:basic membrane lipoprotein Med (substrate-binding protein (PBP1-ABC) superfamily)